MSTLDQSYSFVGSSEPYTAVCGELLAQIFTVGISGQLTSVQIGVQSIGQQSPIVAAQLSIASLVMGTADTETLEVGGLQPGSILGTVSLSTLQAGPGAPSIPPSGLTYQQFLALSPATQTWVPVDLSALQIQVIFGQQLAIVVSNVTWFCGFSNYGSPYSGGSAFTGTYGDWQNLQTDIDGSASMNFQTYIN